MKKQPATDPREDFMEALREVDIRQFEKHGNRLVVNIQPSFFTQVKNIARVHGFTYCGGEANTINPRKYFYYFEPKKTVN